MKMKTIIGSIALFVLFSLLVVSGAWAADPIGAPGHSAAGKNP